MIKKWDVPHGTSHFLSFFQLFQLAEKAVADRFEFLRAQRHLRQRIGKGSAPLQTVPMLRNEVHMEMRNDIDMTAQEIADKFAISKKSLYRYIKILDLTDDLKKMIDEDKLHTDTAEIFCGFSDRVPRQYI